MNPNKLSPYLSIFTDKVCNNIIPEDDIAYKFPYTLDAFQQEGIYRIYKNENILITAHTGSGKTVLATYAIAHCLKKNKRVIYTSPTKSLSNQKYAEFSRDQQNGTIGIMTGDIKMNPDAQCIIMTTEILRNILYKSSDDSIIKIDDIGAVILDEVHYINDPDRGKVWEEVIILLPKEITLVMLSATIDKPEVFASWIGNIKEKPISLIPTSHRVVPLKHYFRWDLLEILDDKGQFKNYDIMRKNYKVHDINRLMDKLIDYLTDQSYTPALFFKFSRKKCELICKTVRSNLLTFEQVAEVEKTFNYYMKDYKKTYEILPQYIDVYNQLKKGVVYHHSGLIPILKEIIEILYTKGLVKILFATETFAIGVNMPTKTVLFTDLDKFDNNGLRSLRTDEYLQMSGRAGRRGLDKFGSVIILPTMNLPDEVSLKGMMTGKSPMLISKFKLTYQFVLKTYGTDINHFLANTLIMNEYDKQAILMGTDKASIENKISQLNITPEMDDIKQYEKINSKLNDTFFALKKKDKDKLEKEKKALETDPTFKKRYDNFKVYDKYNKELVTVSDDIWWCNNYLKHNIDLFINLLKEEKYIVNDKITKKGIVASSINECNELLLTEVIYRGLLDNLEFPEIIAILSAFINEKDQNSNELYISDLNLPKAVIIVLKELNIMADHFIDLENDHKIYIGSDYKLYLDFIEPAYIWASGGTIHQVFEKTAIYDGNFVKSIMRINNICENLFDICKLLEKYDLCQKLEGYSKILIRDITSINSLYVS